MPRPDSTPRDPAVEGAPEPRARPFPLPSATSRPGTRLPRFRPRNRPPPNRGRSRTRWASPNRPITRKHATGGYRPDHERPRGGDEQRIALCAHRCADLCHESTYKRGRQPRDRPAKAAREGDDEAGGEVAEEHQADPLGGIRTERPREYQAPVRDLGDEQSEARGEAGGQRRSGLRRRQCPRGSSETRLRSGDVTVSVTPWRAFPS